MINFDVVSYDEIRDILESRDPSYSSIKDVIRPLFNAGKEFSKIYFLEINNSSFNDLQEAGKELSEKDKESLVVVYTNDNNFVNENVLNEALRSGWVMYADEDINDNSPITFMLLKTELQEDIYNVLHAKMLEFINSNDLKDNDNEIIGKIPYYISYAFIDKSSGSSVLTSLRYIVANFERPINDISDINEIYDKIAEVEKVDRESLFIFGFSKLGDSSVPSPDQFDYEEDKNPDQTDDSMNGDTMVFYCNRITYRLNGEEKIYDSYQNIDLCADEATRLLYAKSIIVQEENLTPEEAEELEILDVAPVDDQLDEEDYDEND